MKSAKQHIKRIGVGFAGAALLLSTAAQANVSYDRAKVIDVDPVYELVNYEIPVEHCRQERVQVREHRSHTGPVLGAVIGGAIGNAVGHKKRNKHVGTLVGAVLGGVIGADVQRRNRHGEPRYGRYETREVCDTTYENRQEERINGYNVRYVYAGQTYQTHMQRDPGDYLRVRVRVAPAR